MVCVWHGDLLCSSCRNIHKGANDETMRSLAYNRDPIGMRSHANGVGPNWCKASLFLVHVGWSDDCFSLWGLHGCVYWKWSLYFKVIGTMAFIFLLGTLSINYDMINVNDMPVVYYWLCMAIAMLLIAVVIAIGFQKLAQPFAFISVVSYETYLAHDPFRFVPHPPFSLDNKFIFLFYFIIVTILQGWVLHLLVSIVYRYIGWAKDWMCSKFPKLAK